MRKLSSFKNSFHINIVRFKKRLALRRVSGRNVQYSSRGFVNRFRRVGFLRILIFFSLIFIGVYAFLTYPVVKDITLSTENGDYIDSSKLEKYLETKYLGAHIFLIETRSFQKELAREFPEVLGLRFKRNLPDNLSVAVSGRTPVIQVRVEETEDYFLLDIDGVVISNQAKDDLPLVNIQGSVEKGVILKSPEIKFLIDLLGKLGQSHEINNISFISENSLKMELDNISVLFSTQLTAEEQIYRFDSVFEHYTVKNVRLKSVDLRFNRPVVAY